MKINVSVSSNLIKNNTFKYLFRVMKISFILLFVFSFQLMAINTNAQDAIIHVKTNSISIGQLINEIEKQTDYLVVYSNREVNTTNVVHLRSGSEKVSQCLRKALEGTDIGYDFENNYIVLSKRANCDARSIARLIETVQQQGKKIQGTVLDSKGDPIIGANIIEVGTPSNGTITDYNGKFSLRVGENAVIRLSYIGYLEQEISTAGKTSFNIVLKEDTKALDEVVVVGYGTQTRREITGSVANITQKDFNQGATQNAADLLQGKVAGLSITSASGDLNDNSIIRLRGVNTLQKDNGPFIVIDGVPGGDLSSVAPQDIESISVLKDASSAAIYGSRSAGGVILITTKRGSGSNQRISYNGYLALSNAANKPDMLSAQDWRNYVNENGLTKQAKAFDKYNANTDWFGEILRTGISHNHSLSLSGGGSSHNYRASVNYRDMQGIMKDNSFENINFRFQFSQRAINEKLKIGVTGVANVRNISPSNKTNTMLASNFLPVYPVYKSDGSWFDLTEFNQGNPLRQIKENQRDIKIIDFYGNADIEFNFTKNLTGKLTLYKQRMGFDYSQYDSSESYSGRDPKGFAKRSSFTRNKDLLESTLTYNTLLRNTHKLTLLGGYSWEQNDFQSAYAQNRSFITIFLGANDLQSGQNLLPEDVGSEKNMYRLISFFTRANYAFKERYMLTTTLRYDGSSKFGKNNKWGTFPSVSAAWGISQEDFMNDIYWVNDIKLRVGYGITGNQDGLDPYKTLELYGHYGSYYDAGHWYTAYRISQNANPNLKWEQTASFNVGLDFTLLKNRLSGTVEWYKKNTSDMLYEYTVPTPPFLHDKIMANVGNMLNTGIEFVLTARVLSTKDFSWTSSFNGAFNKNEVTKLSNDLYSTNRLYVGDVGGIRGMSATTSTIIEEGYPVGQFYMLKCDGIDSKGKYIIENIDDNDEISDADRTYVGNPQPDFVFGWQNTLNYKNWDFSLFFRGTYGNDVLNVGKIAYSNSQSLIGANVRKEALEIGLSQAPQLCSYYIEDASHIRLDNATMGYTFNTSKLGWLNSARVYVTGQNLFVLTKYTGLDPEVKMDGVDPGKEEREFYPKPRTFTFGVSLNF